MKTIYLFLIGFAITNLLSCKKDDTLKIDPWAENIKLIPSGSKFYFVADVEGIPGIQKIIYPGPNDKGSTDIGRAICNIDECHTLLVMGDPENTQEFWLAIILQKKGLNGFDNLIHEGNYSYSTPTNRANGVNISFTFDNLGEFRTDYFDNNNIQGKNFEITKINNINDDQFIESRFNCELHSFKGQTISIKNAIWKINL